MHEDMAPSQNITALVTGATGAQGGAVARALLDSGVSVRALVRDAARPAAKALAELGVTLVLGDLDDAASLALAMRGVTAVFSVQLSNPRQPEREVAQARALIAAAKDAGVASFIQSSVSAVGLYKSSPRDDGLWDRPYWRSKADVEDAAQNAGFPSATILRPAFMMENFARPKAAHMFSELAHGRLRTVLSPTKPLALIAARDIGAAAAHAVLAPPPHAIHELASDLLTPPDIAAVLSAAWGRTLVAETATDAELLASGHYEGWIRMQHWMNTIGYPARTDALGNLGLAPTRLATWAASGEPA